HNKCPNRESLERLASLDKDLVPRLSVSKGEAWRRLSICLGEVEDILCPILSQFDKDLIKLHERVGKLQGDIETTRRQRPGMT
ncbi:MAG: hypothetical protein ACYCPT_11325, partial [Acidimicrobiales bacterium]